MGKIGRPSSYSPEIGEAICARIAAGETLTAICELPDFPSRSTVSRWLCHPEPSESLRAFATAYAHAREAQAEGEFDEIRELADGTHEEACAEADAACEGFDDLDSRAARKLWRQRYYESLNAKKLQIDARKFRVARMNASKYGDKAQVQVSTPPGQPIEVEVMPSAERVAQVLNILREAGALPSGEPDE